jgi:hypothetical protein
VDVEAEESRSYLEAALALRDWMDTKGAEIDPIETTDPASVR